jgi:hypothetical protein
VTRGIDSTGAQRGFFFLLLLLAGCSAPPRRFPIGLYDVPPSDFPAVSAAGFNTIVGSASRLTLNAALTNNLSLIGSVSVMDHERIRALGGHPALWGWYLFDEPDLHLVSPENVARLNSKLHALSPKPTMIVLMSGSAVEKYRGRADLIGVDWYPVPWAPVATVAREMRLARVGTRGRPFYAVLQAFDWSSSPELLRTDTPLRPPSREELRCMTYLALTQGATGLLFYTYDNDQWKLREHPELWNALSNLAQEVQQNAPIFKNRIEWWPAETKAHGPPADMYNEIMDARVLLTLFRVHKASRSILPGCYLIAVNTSASSADLAFKLPFAGLQAVPGIGTDAAVVSDAGWVRKQFAPFEVSIFGPIQGELQE